MNYLSYFTHFTHSFNLSLSTYFLVIGHCLLLASQLFLQHIERSSDTTKFIVHYSTTSATRLQNLAYNTTDPSKICAFRKSTILPAGVSVDTCSGEFPFLLTEGVFPDVKIMSGNLFMCMHIQGTTDLGINFIEWRTVLRECLYGTLFTFYVVDRANFEIYPS
jgi:hypothetical protein